MMTRRSLALAVTTTWPAWLRSGVACAALPVPASNAINARVLRKGDDIGTAKYVFERDNDLLRVRIAVDLVVKLGPIPVFRYTHRNVETWRGDTLVATEAKTDDDGTPKFCTIKRVAEGLMVTGSRGAPYVAPADAVGTTYWDYSRTMNSPLINTEDGHLLAVRLVPNGQKTVTLADGTALSVREYNMTGDLKLDLFYDDHDAWAAMNYYAKDKSVVNYRRE